MESSETNENSSFPTTSSTSENPQRFRKIRNKRTLTKQILNRLSLGISFEDKDFLANPEWKDYDPADITKFINDFARKAQLRAEMETKTFHSPINKIAGILAPSRDELKHEIPLAIEAISSLEKNIPSGNPNPVYLSAIYQNLAKMMKGEPCPEWRAEDINVIQEVVNEVLAEVESPQGQKDLQRLEELLTSNTFEEFTQDQAMELKSIFGDPNFNPLKLPLEFLVNQPFLDRSS